MTAISVIGALLLYLKIPRGAGLLYFHTSYSIMSDPEHPPASPAPNDAQHVGKSASSNAAGKSATRQQLLAVLTATDVTIRRLDL